MKPCALQRLLEQRHGGLAVGEDDAVLHIGLGAQELAQRFALGLGIMRRLHQPLLDARGRRGGGVASTRTGLCRNWPVMPLDLRRHGGREEHGLAREGQQLADALDVGDEAHVEHAVGLVDHQHVDAGEQQLAALEMVEQAARRGDDHIGAAVDLGGLSLEGHTADEEGDGEVVLLAQRLEGLAHLVGQFARRFEDEGARHARPGAALFEQRQHGQHEGRGLARAGLGEAQHVPALEGVGNGLRLDGRGRGVSGGGNRFEDFGAQSELCERHVL